MLEGNAVPGIAAIVDADRALVMLCEVVIESTTLAGRIELIPDVEAAIDRLKAAIEKAEEKPNG